MQQFTKSLPNEMTTLNFGKALARATIDPDYLARELAASALPEPGRGAPTCGGIIHLHGDLGAGKTTLTRGVMRGFGYLGAVKSPTYTLVEPYEFTLCSIYHFDLYRLSASEEVGYLGTDDYFSGEHLCIIEWAERGQGYIPAADLTLTLSEAGTGRELDCQTGTEKGSQIAQRLWGKGRRI